MGSIGDQRWGLSPAFTTFSLAPQFVKQNIFTTSDDVFKTVGKHALKFGVLWNHYQDEVLRETGAKGSSSFNTILLFMTGRTDVMVHGTYTSSSIGVGQDIPLQYDWTLRPG